ncbi:hypothetical protein P154DRAFT_573457 [Amniculicola lignicola CBS 123094]|uniref:Uncharacterized protein n=1 Tax=Amniculicola lignicola CBS 123094 TaxID=1392246 RepID=A0A6A5WVF1_9PLEO|nr:hypothetical protein P154DRAFT_573457 [Amniculicola lignicola CBS 123094]
MIELKDNGKLPGLPLDNAEDSREPKYWCLAKRDAIHDTQRNGRAICPAQRTYYYRSFIHHTKHPFQQPPKKTGRNYEALDRNSDPKAENILYFHRTNKTTSPPYSTSSKLASTPALCTHPTPHPGSTNPPPWEYQSNQRAGEECGLTLELRSNAPHIISRFPELQKSYIVHGDRALRACKLITFHELFERENTNAFELVGEGDWRCQPELLPDPIQRELYNYLRGLWSVDETFSSDAVFHAEMYEAAIKYMLPNLRSAILCALRKGGKPWIYSSPLSGHGFVSAIDLLWQLSLEEREADALEILETLANIMAANWGWMRHDEGVTALLRAEEFAVLSDKIQETVIRLSSSWEIEDASGGRTCSVWGDRSRL